MKSVAMLCLWVYCGIFAQLKFNHLNIEDGLSQSTVFAIAKDHFGYMWFATEDGLNRFDAYDFRIYRSSSDSNSLSNTFVRSLIVDNENRTWIGTVSGLNYYDPSNGKIHRIKDPYLSKANIMDLDYDGENLWFRFRGDGFAKYNIGKKVFTHLANKIAYTNKTITSILFTDSKLYYGSDYGLFAYDTIIDKSIELFTNFKQKPRVRHIVKSKENLIVTASDGIYIVNIKSQTAKKLNITNWDQVKNVTKTLFDSANRLWIGTISDGLFIYNYNLNRLDRYTYDPLNPSSLSGNFIESFFEDDNGLVWLGSNAAGINIYDPFRQKFKHFKMQHENFPTDNVIYALFADEENLWIGTEKAGLNVYNRKTAKYKVYLPNGTNRSIYGKSIRSIVEDQNGKIWIGSSDAGISIYDRHTQKFEHFNSDIPFFKNLVTRTILEDKYNKDLMWFGTARQGFIRYNKKDRSYKQYTTNSTKGKGLSNTDIRAVIMDSEGIIWIGTLGGGLNRFDSKKEVFTYYRADKGKKSLSHDIIIGIVESKDKKGLWLGTGGGGFSYFDKAKNEFTNYSEKDGLANDVVYVAYPDAHGNIWATTNNGISKYNIKAKTFRNYSSGDGLQSNEFNIGAYTETNDGELVFGGINGFNIFNPNKIVDNQMKPKIYLTEFNVFEKAKAFKSDISNINSIELNYFENFISFRYTALNYTYPKANRFEYKMIGVDKNWIEASNRRYVNYTDLDHGSYEFHIRASNNDGVWNKEGKKIAIKIATPPWLTWWAFCIYAVIFFALVWLTKWLIKNWRFLISPRTKFIGKYKILSTLGVGSMSKVYEAFDPDSKELVAIKVVENEENTADDIFRMFIKEAEIGKELNHPNIVKVFGSGTTNDLRFLTMEKVDGVTLKFALKNNLINAEKDHDFLILELLEGISYLHSKGIIHRDIKSSNILINLEKRTLKVTDFGLATSKNLISLNERSNLVGTLAYMSPEQSVGRQVDMRTDIYAIGVLIYELLFEKIPYEAENEMALIFAIHNETPEQFIISNHPLIGIIKRCMKRDPNDRFQSVSEIQDAIKQIRKVEV